MELIVVFRSQEEPRWWSRLLRPGFHHCFTIHKREHDDRWIISDWCQTRLDVMTLLPGELGNFMAKVDTAWVRIQLSENHNPGIPFVKFGLLTCVNYTLHLMGHYQSTIITPYQLYRYLLRLGAEDFNSERIIRWRQKRSFGTATRARKDAA